VVGKATAVAQYEEVIRRNDEAIRHNEEAIKDNRAAIEDNRAAIEDNRAAIGRNNRLIDESREAIKGINGHSLLVRDGAFYQLLLDCKPRPIEWRGKGDDPFLQVATLPDGYSWLTLNSRVLFVRRCYDDLWNLVDAHYQKRRQGPVQRVLLLGTPGIGKTVSMNYFLMRALQAGYKVLFETRERRFYFHDGVVESERVYHSALSVIDADPNVFFLVDHQDQRAPRYVDAFTVAAMSPDPRVYKEFIKNRCVQFWVPLPSESEIIAMNSVEPQLPSDELQSRLATFGPILRSVFAVDQGACKAVMGSRISSFDYGRVARLRVLDAEVLPKEFPGLSWSVLHLTTENYRATKVVWASRSVMQQVLNEHVRQNLHALEEVIVNGLKEPLRMHDMDIEYQYWACQMLARGGKWAVYEAKLESNKIEYSQKDVFELAPGRVEFMQSLSVSVMVQQPGVLHYATKTNEPLCDAALVQGPVLFLFQATIGQTHGFAKDTWQNYCKAAAASQLTEVHFVYVVPHLNNFKVPNYQVLQFQQPHVSGIRVCLEVVPITPNAQEISQHAPLTSGQ
jgi:hypothetical protein